MPEPVAIDPQTNTKHVLVRQEVYERLKALIAMNEYDPDEVVVQVHLHRFSRAEI